MQFPLPCGVVADRWPPTRFYRCSTYGGTMYRPGHHGIAMLVYAPFGGLLAALGSELPALAGGIFLVYATMVPDYDRRVGWLRRRGPTHTVWFALLFGAAAGLAAVVVGSLVFRLAANWSFAFGFALGTLAVVVHIAADALTPAGVRPFAPLHNSTYTFEAEFASSAPGNYALFGVGLLAIAFAFLLGGTIAG